MLPEAASDKTESGQRTVLCIDDDPDSIALFEAILGHAGEFALLSAASGDAGLDLALERSPDLILLDFDLPDRHGTEVLQRLREDERTRSIPVIGISATSHPSPNYVRGSGLNAFLRKPLDDIPAFLALVKRQLGDGRAVPGQTAAGR